MDIDIEELIEASSVGFIDYAGIRFTMAGNGHAEGEIVIEPHHLNPAGALHGGLIFTIMDTIGGFAARTLGVLPTTLTSNINYLRPTLGTKKITAKADVIKRGKNVSVVRIDIFDDRDVLVASGASNYSDLTGRVEDESIKNLARKKEMEGSSCPDPHYEHSDRV